MCLDFGAYAFAERVQRDQHALMIESLGHAQRVANLHPGNEAGTHLPAEAGALAKITQNPIAGKCNESGTKNGHMTVLSAGWFYGGTVCRTFKFRIMGAALARSGTGWPSIMGHCALQGKFTQRRPLCPPSDVVNYIDLRGCADHDAYMRQARIEQPGHD